MQIEIVIEIQQCFENSMLHVQIEYGKWQNKWIQNNCVARSIICDTVHCDVYMLYSGCTVHQLKTAYANHFTRVYQENYLFLIYWNNCSALEIVTTYLSFSVTGGNRCSLWFGLRVWLLELQIVSLHS